MNELLRETINAAERAVVGEDSQLQEYFERLLSNPSELQAGRDEERAYLAVLLDYIGCRDEAIHVLRDASDSKPIGVNATLRNLEGMLAAVHGQYGQAQDILKEALSAAEDSPSLRVKILANLAAVSLRAGSAEQAEEWAAASNVIGDAGNPAAHLLIASVQASIASDRKDTPALRIAASSLGEASMSRIAELGTQHPQALVTVVNMANTEIMLARAEGAKARLERAVGVLEIAASRLAAELGADHPQALMALESLVLAQLDLARADGSAQRLEQAIAALAAASRRVGLVLGDTHPEVQVMEENLAAARRVLSMGEGSDNRTERVQVQLGREYPSGAPIQDSPDLAQGRRNFGFALLEPLLRVGSLFFIVFVFPFFGFPFSVFYLVLLLAVVPIYLAYLVIVISAAAVVACAVYALGVPGAYFVGLWHVLVNRTAYLSSPEHLPKIPAGADPAILQYFYGPAVADADQVIHIAYKGCQRLWKSGISVVGYSFTSNQGAMFTWPYGVGVAIGMALGTTAGTLITAVFAFIYLLVVGISVALVRVTGTVLRSLTSAVLWVKNMRMVCPFCYELVPYPAYACPSADCTYQHRDIRPGRYGILRRRCRCGTRMNTFLLFGSSRMAPFCPSCGRPLEHRPGKAPEIVLPFFGATGAGKTRLLLSMITQLRVWTDQGRLTAESGDTFTTRELEIADQMLHSGSPTATTSFDLPQAHVIRLIIRKSTRTLQMYDAAGEHFYNTDRTQELRYLNRARTFILVIDPLSVEAFWQQLPAAAQAELSPARSAAPPPELAYQQTYQQIETMGVQTRKARLAVVFSRADLIGIPDGDVVEWARNELDLGNMIRSTAQNFKETRYFCTAAVMDADGLVHEYIAELMQWVLARDSIDLSGAIP